MSKLVEWVVAKQLMQRINSNSLGNLKQSAYKGGHFIETTLLLIKNEIHLSLSYGVPTALVLQDLSSAFNTIDHTILLKLWFGVCGTALKWFTSYFSHTSHRLQSIKIGSSLSEFCELLIGVPRGSVLCPLLFSLYTTPLSKVVEIHPDIKFHFHADDTQLFIHITSRSRGFRGSYPPPPPPTLLNNTVKGFNPGYKKYRFDTDSILRVLLILQEMHYIFTKNYFFPQGACLM